MFDASGKVALVTGATGGIGEATVRLLLECNAKVIATGRSPSKLNAIFKNENDVFPIKANFSKEKEAKAAINRSIDQFEKIDYVIHCAGAVGSGCLSDTSLDEWYKILDINLTSAFLLCREAYPILKKTSGSVVLLSSINGTHGGSNVSGPVYAISKAGINNMTRYLAKEWAKDNIRVNCVSPGPVDTPMLDRLTLEQHKNAKAATLLGKYSTAEECAGLIVFLCSPWAQSMTGTIENISSGIVLD
ncbi:MAG: hypothetical protein CMM49_08435 [Rhodospirillaceae bacterium]|nr:hypothetical protein [Rhodospirillaceae bacterium]